MVRFSAFSFLLAAVAITTACNSHGVLAILDFTGPGTVSCPDVDDVLRRCKFGFVDNNPLRCFSCAASSGSSIFGGSGGGLPDLVPTISETEISFPLACECVQVTRCPDECTFSSATDGSVDDNDGTGVSTLAPAAAPPLDDDDDLLDFVGPGIIVCPSLDFFRNLCSFGVVTTVEDCSDSCVDLLPTLGAELELRRQDGTIALPLPCECLQATRCASSCTLEESSSVDEKDEDDDDGDEDEDEDEDTKEDFAGPGVLSCPASDYFRSPCFPTDVSECDLENCNYSNGLQAIPQLDMLTTSFETIVIPLPCACLTAVGCSSTCTLEKSNATASSTGTNFTGPGLVTCSSTSFALNTCVIDVSQCTTADNDANDGANCTQPVATELVRTGLTFELACACQQMRGCDDSCSLSDSFMISEPPAPTTSPGPTTATAAPAADRDVMDFPFSPTVDLGALTGFPTEEPTMTSPTPIPTTTTVSAPVIAPLDTGTDAPFTDTAKAPVGETLDTDAPATEPSSTMTTIPTTTTVSAPVIAPLDTGTDAPFTDTAKAPGDETLDTDAPATEPSSTTAPPNPSTVASIVDDLTSGASTPSRTAMVWWTRAVALFVLVCWGPH